MTKLLYILEFVAIAVTSFVGPLAPSAAEEPKGCRATLWRIITDFQNPNVSRKALLARFQSAAKDFPNSEYSQEIQHSIKLLRTMVTEDMEHERKAGKPAGQMTTSERVAELIFQLRDQSGGQVMQPGRCNIFLPRNDHVPTPAEQLVEIGYDAVPQLIDALSDERFSRAVGFHRDFYFSHYVLRIGDCSRAILERIGGRTFYDRASTSSEMVKDGAVAKVRERVKAWWAEARVKGEKRMLIEGVAAGDQNSDKQAERLVKKYPAAALDAIRTGAKNSREAWVRTNLVIAARELPTPQTMPFFLDELNAPWRCARIASAVHLAEQKRPEAIDALIREWKKLPLDEDGFFAPAEGLDDAIRLLARSGRKDAIEALVKDLGKRAAVFRLDVVEQIGDVETATTGKPAAKEIGMLIEDALAARLSDREVVAGRFGVHQGRKYYDPRVCDVAGIFLSKRLNAEKAFDFFATKEVRDRQLFELTNTWRLRRGLKPLSRPDGAPKPP